MKQFSKLLSFLLCCLLLTALPLAAAAQNTEEPEFSFFYDVIDRDRKFIVVHGLDGPVIGGVLTIPPKINGYTVKEIGWDAFSNRRGLTEVILPDTVAYIGGNAFRNCEKLERVTLPAALKEIDNEAFTDCTSLKEIAIPDSVGRIGNYAFSGCGSLQTATLPAALEHLDDGVFSRCASLKEIALPETLRGMGGNVFQDCRSLTEVALPPHLEYVSENAFAGCASLEKLLLPEGLIDIGPYSFLGCRALTELNLPASLRGIAEFAFADCVNLPSVHIPAHVGYVNTDAFVNCAAMTALTVDPENRNFTAADGILYDKEMGALIVYPTGKPGEAFKLPDSVNSIEGRWAFSGTALQSLDINRANYIAPGAIAASGVSQLTKAKDNDRFIIQNNVLYNENGEILLAYPGGLTADTFTVPENIRNIEDSAFCSNPHLKKVILPEGLEQIMYCAFADSAVSEVVIPASVRVLGNAVFQNCVNLKKANIPDGIISIRAYMFAGCEALEQVAIPASVRVIGESAFEECRSLKTVALPEDLSNINYGAFRGCGSLKEMTISNKVAFIEEEAFAGTPWFDALPDGPVYLNTVLYAYKGEIPENTAFVVKEGTTMITARALAWQWGLSDLTVPDSLMYVGDEAVAGTRWFEEILPRGPVYIGKTFYRYKGEMTEKSFALKEGTFAVTPGAFWELRNVETLSLPATLEELQDGELFDLHGLKAFTVSEDNAIFSAADGVLFSKDGAQLLCYPSCKEDKAYEVPYGVEILAWHAFSNNEQLETLTVHATLRECFETIMNCPALKDVYYGGVRKDWIETNDSYNLLQNNAQLHITHEDVFRDEGGVIVVAPGCDGGDIMSTLDEGEGVDVIRPNGDHIQPMEPICSGMIVTRKDGKKATLVLTGDTDGDGDISSADARNALRYSVNLDDPTDWQQAAAKVSGEEAVSSADARLILRASVGLENPMDWYRAA